MGKKFKTSPEQIAGNVFSSTRVENLTHQSHFGGWLGDLEQTIPSFADIQPEPRGRLTGSEGEP